jgi:hypothetical protein
MLSTSFEVHHDVAEVAGEPHALAVGRDVEDLAAGAAVEEQRVGARLAFDGVAAVARIPLEDVVAGAQERDVVALLAVDEVVAVAAEQQVGAVAAEDRVVAGAAVDGDLDQRREVAGGRKLSSPPFVEDQVLGRADVEGEGRGIEAVEADAGAVGGGGEDLGAAAAVDLDGVDAVAAFVQVGVVAGFQIMRSLPDSPKTGRCRRRRSARRRSPRRRRGSRRRPFPSSVSLPPGRRAGRRRSRRSACRCRRRRTGSPGQRAVGVDA